MGKKLPPEVLQAIREDNRNALSEMGKVGGKKAGEISKRHADERALSEAVKAEEEEKNIADATAHAEANRIGWDDDYRP